MVTAQFARSAEAPLAPVPVRVVSSVPSWAPALVVAVLAGGAAVLLIQKAVDEQARSVAAQLQGARAEVTTLRSQLEVQFAAERQRLQKAQEELQKAEAARLGSARERTRMAEEAVARVDAVRAKAEREFQDRRQALDAYLSGAEDQAKKVRDAVAAVANTQPASKQVLIKELLLPTVQLNGEDSVGSGTIVFSDLNPALGTVQTYVLTSHHVVRNILADTPRAQQEGIDVTVYLPGEKFVVKGRMVASQSKIDAALVQLDTGRRLPCVARVLPRERNNDVEVWDAIHAVGCPLGNDPVPSSGTVSSLRNELNGANYWMINAPTYFGSSGGGVYATATRELVGVFSKIYTYGKGTPVVVPHMGLITPMPAIRAWLEEEKLDFVLGRRAEGLDLAAK